LIHFYKRTHKSKVAKTSEILTMTVENRLKEMSTK